MADYYASLGKTKISPEFHGLITSENIKVGNILDDLGITQLCCRQMIMTEVTFKDIIDDSVGE